MCLKFKGKRLFHLENRSNLFHIFISSKHHHKLNCAEKMCGRLMANYAVTLACFQHQRIKLEYIQDGIIQKEFLWFWMDSWGLQFQEIEV